MKRLPEAEFDVMKAVWALDGPATAGQVWTKLGAVKDWRVQTVITLLSRLVERGFLETEKFGKERRYKALIQRDAYLQFETGNFVRQYHGNSVSSFVNALYEGHMMDDADVDELLRWWKKRKDETEGKDPRA